MKYNDYMEQSLKKTFWSDAAIGGAVIGVALFAVALADALFELDGAGGGIRLLNFAVLAFFIFIFGRRRSLKYGADGYTFSQSMGYILAMMLFTGLITGLTNYLLYNYVAPEYVMERYEAAFMNNPMINSDSQLGRQYLDAAVSLLRNPLFLVFSGIFGWVIYGGCLGLIASAFIKRKPDIFDGNHSDNQPAG